MIYKKLIKKLKMKDYQIYHSKRNLNYLHKIVQDVELNCKYKMKIKWVIFKKVNYQNITIKQKKKKKINHFQNQDGSMNKTIMTMKY